MRLIRSTRGSLLVHVLVTSVIVAVVAAALMRLMLMRYVITTRMSEGAAGRVAAQSAFQNIMDVWTTNQITCSDPSTTVGMSGYSCSPLQTIRPGACSCSCTANVTTPSGALIPVLIVVSPNVQSWIPAGEIACKVCSKAGDVGGPAPTSCP